jgi:serine/threonine-protein kinase RsbW
VEVKLTLALPRDEVSVPVVRRLLKQSMEVLGVEPEDRSDIKLAITECCTNVLDHARAGDDYEVTCGIRDDGCHIRVIDHGCGFDPDRLPRASATAEQGRGGAAADTGPRGFCPIRATGGGRRSRLLRKRLRFVTGSPAERLSDQ